MQEPNLVALAAALSGAKLRESKARKERTAAEDAIIKLTGFSKAEGQQKYDEDDESGSCEIVIKQSIRTKVDSDAWLSLRRTLVKDHPARGIFETKFSLKTKEARELQETDKEHWVDIADVISRKPGKIAVEVKSVSLTGGLN